MNALAALRKSRGVLYILAFAAVVLVLSRNHLSYLLGVVVFVVGLIFSVVLHELGHFLSAKKFGMKATQFFIGWGNTLWSTKRGETEYGVKSLPVGAFVRITGMTTMDEVEPGDEPRAMRNKPRWQRAIVMVGGSFMHFALAFVLLLLLALAIGEPVTNSTKVGQVSPCLAANAAALNKGSCAGSSGPSPAGRAGLKAGDVITSVGGKPVQTWTQAGTVIRELPVGKPAAVVVTRDGRSLTLHLTPATVPGRSGSYLGIVQAQYFQRQNPVGAVAFAGNTIGEVLVGTVQAFGRLPQEIPALFNRNQQSGLSSVVGMAEGAGQAVEYGGGWQYTVFDLLQIIILVNISVGALNLLPLLPLDGGHLAMIGYEQVRAWVARLRGRRDPGVADLQPLIPISATVFVLLVGLSVLLIAANLFNPVHLIQ